MHLDIYEQPIPPQMTSEIFFSDLRDDSLFGHGAPLVKPGIPAQPNLYLADQRHYVDGLQNIPLQLQLGKQTANWRPVME